MLHTTELIKSMKCRIPAGNLSDVTVRKFRVSKHDAMFHNMRCAMKPTGHLLTIRPGNYTKLGVGGVLMMSDTPAELIAHLSFVRKATGSVLITGLGLGIVVKACLAKPEVTDVTVVEHNQNVIDLIIPHLPKRKLTVINGDAFTWKPPKGKRYNAVWHDIWATIDPDNSKEMGTLCRRFARRADWQDCWQRELVRYLVRTSY